MVLSDIKYTLRLLLKKPGFSLLTILVMATGIGLSVYMFSFLNTMLFKDLPFENGSKIVQISASEGGFKTGDQLNLSDYHEISTNLQGLTEFGGYTSKSVNVSGRDGVRRYSATLAEPNIFQVTRTKPALGRGFNDVENQPNSEAVVVISHDLWENRFAGADSVIGESLKINGTPHQIIGVMPKGYSFPVRAELWLPLKQNRSTVNRNQAEHVYGLARLDDSASVEQINLDINTVMQRLSERYPKTNTGISAYVDTFQMAVVGDGLTVVYSMHIVAILILILASVNVANLMLARAIERSKETAIRVALGAPKYRLVGQLMLESVLICLVAGLAALGLISLGLSLTESATASFSIDKPPFWWVFGIDGFTILLLVMFVVLTVVLTGLIPALKNTGGDFNAVLRDGTRGATSKKTGRINKLLVIGEIFISMAVLIAAAVISFATYKATEADYGADTSGKLVSDLILTESKYATDEQKVQFVQSLEANLKNRPEIDGVMISSALPGNYSDRKNIALENREYSDTDNTSYPRVNYVTATVGTLQNLGVSLLQGRYFDSSDKGLGKNSVVVTESFVARHFKDEDPLGQRVRVVESDDSQPNWLQIVGVVEHTIQGSPVDDVGKPPTMFRPYSQDPGPQLNIAMGMQAGEKQVTDALRQVMLSLDPDLPAFSIETYDETVSRNIAPLRFGSAIFLIFGIAAVVLSASGIYGVMSNTVNAKAQEIGVKKALGASDDRITRELLWLGFKHLLWGGIPGLLVGCAMGFGMSQLFGIDGSSLLIIAVCLVLIISTAVMFATYWPTRKVVRLEPADILRGE